MSERKRFDIISNVVSAADTTVSVKKFEITDTTFVVPRQVTQSGKLTITNNSRPRICPRCQSEGQITYIDEKHCLCKVCDYRF